MSPIPPDILGSPTSHSGPWKYVQHVPLFLYGPGYIEPQGRVDRPVTVAGLVPTMGELLGFDSPGQEQVLHEALIPAAERPVAPKLIVVLVWDSAGRNVLKTHSGSWPVLEGLIPHGTWYDEAVVGSSPSDTPPIHTTIGTGVYPKTHGIIDLMMEIGSQMTGPFRSGPQHMESLSLGDEYDPSTGNDAKVGMVASVPGHLGMIGHGTFRNGGDADVAVLKSRNPGEWWGLPSNLDRYYRFPGYVHDVVGFKQDKRRLDVRDGNVNGKWRDNLIKALDGGFDTPA